MIDAACDREGVARDQLVIHSDKGGHMKAATLLPYLQEFGMATSLSRPSVSNGNSYSESLFRTAKYRPEYPSKPFVSLAKARAWATSFVGGYNTEHRHSSIKFVTPDQQHTGEDVELLVPRSLLYEEARARNPRRCTGTSRDWGRVGELALNPEDEAAWTWFEATTILTPTGYVANQARVALAAMAYVLIQELRWHLRHTEFARAHAGSIGLCLFKIGARVQESMRRIVLRLPAQHPFAAAWRAAALSLGAAALPAT